MARVFSKLKRAAGLLSLISMMLSSVAACACSHHSALVPDSEDSCHTHPESSYEQDQTQAGLEKGQMVSRPSCSCPQVSPRLVFKQDQKQLQINVAIVPAYLLDLELVDSVTESKVIDFNQASFRQSFLRDSTAGRAPPRPNFV